MIRWMASHVGLARPFRFERTLAVLVSLVLGVFTVALVWRYGLAIALVPGSPRSWYFAYLAFLLGLGIVCARRPRVTMIVLSLAAAEIGIGFGSVAMTRHDLADSDLMPSSAPRQVERVWHPLLQATNVPTSKGSRGIYRVDSEGLRGRERSASELRDKTVVAVFGGSTTEDLGGADGETWPERLESLLGSDRFAVLNHGVTANSTVQIVIRTAFYQGAYDRLPDCAVYYVGGADVLSSHVADLDPGFANHQTPQLVDALEARRIERALPGFSPLLRLLGRLAAYAFDTVRAPPTPAGKVSGDPDPALETIFLRNVRTISSINRERGITTIWIGETFDFDSLVRSGGRSGMWGAYLRVGDLQALLSRLNRLLQREAAALGDTYVGLDEKQFTAGDFADGEHFSAKGAARFASLIAPEIATACRKRERSARP
jgi:lysophospholipase L1-like esterase